MAISPISPIANPIVAPTMATLPTAKADESGGGFGDMISQAVENLNAAHSRADALAVQAATGDLNAAHDYTIAATEAQLLTSLTVEVRNRAIEAFNDIMRMQV